MAQAARLTRSAFAAAMCALAFSATTAHAGDIVSSSSVSIDQFRYRLVDLTPDDGIAPSLTISSGWLARQSLRADDIWAPNTVTEIFNGPSNLFGSGPAVSGSSADGSVNYQVGPDRISLSSHLSSQQMFNRPEEYVSDHVSYTVDESGQWYQQQTTSRMAHFDSLGNNIGTLDIGTPAGEPVSVSNLLAKMTLSANTLLIVEGNVTGTVMADRSAMMDRIASVMTAQDGETMSPTFAMSGSGESRLMARITMYEEGSNAPLDDDGLFNLGYGGGTGADFIGSVRYADTGFLNNIGEVVSEELTRTRTFSDKMSLAYTNFGEASKSFDLVLGLETSQYEQAMAYGVFEKLGERVALAESPYGPPVIEEPPVFEPPVIGIPEPGTYALMGLGLVGLASMRRRQAGR